MFANMLFVNQSIVRLHFLLDTLIYKTTAISIMIVKRLNLLNDMLLLFVLFSVNREKKHTKKKWENGLDYDRITNYNNMSMRRGKLLNYAKSHSISITMGWCSPFVTASQTVCRQFAIQSQPNSFLFFILPIFFLDYCSSFSSTKWETSSRLYFSLQFNFIFVIVVALWQSSFLSHQACVGNSLTFKLNKLPLKSTKIRQPHKYKQICYVCAWLICVYDRCIHRT